MRLMTNQVLMRIDSFIRLQLCARCSPLLMPGKLKGNQDMVWGRLGIQRQQREGTAS